MATTAQNFFLSITDHDGAWGTDIRKLVEVLPANNADTRASFGTAAAEIILDPLTNRSTVGTANAPDFGWAINQLGADGMESTATAKRIVPAGTWHFRGFVNPDGVTTSTYRVRWRVYRVGASGTRTLLFGPINSQTSTIAVLGTLYEQTSVESEIVLEADETLLVSWAIEKTNTSLAGEIAQFQTANSAGNSSRVQVPTPGVRTRHLKTHQVIANALGSLLKKVKLPRSRTVNATPTMARRLTLFRRGTNTVNATATMSRRLTLRRTASSVANVSASVAKRVKLPRAVTATGLGSVVKKVKLPRTKTVNATPTVAKKLRRTRTVTANVFATGARALTIRRTFAVTANVVMRALAKMDTRLIPSGGGGETVVHDASSTGGSPLGLQFIRPLDDEKPERVPDQTLATIVASLLTFKKSR